MRVMDAGYAKYRIWFVIAAAYNLVWGIVVSAFPSLLFDLLKMPQPTYPALMQCIGMMVGVYAIGYGLIAKDPVRYGPVVYVGLLGKVLGPLGFLASASLGQLPWRFGWINVFNDLIWLPIFVPFAILVVRHEGKS